MLSKKVIKGKIMNDERDIIAVRLQGDSYWYNLESNTYRTVGNGSWVEFTYKTRPKQFGGGDRREMRVRADQVVAVQYQGSAR